MSSGLTGILLAAGSSRRFGSNKLLHRLPDGTPMAVASARKLQPACERLIAVLNPDAHTLADLLAKAGCDIVICEDAQGGMGHSLAAGVRASDDASEWLLALGDMPFIQTTTHEAVAACLQSGASLAATQYQGRRGHPVGFSNKWFKELAAMTGDHGGRMLLKQHRSELVLCPVSDPGVLQDFDSPEDLSNIARFASSIGR